MSRVDQKSDRSGESYWSIWNKKNPGAQASASRRWAENNPDRRRRILLKSWLKTNYGLSLEDYEEMHRSQQGRCAICRSKIEKGGAMGAHVDHCHETGKVRGLLCKSCNTGLGGFKDKESLLSKAIRYLRGDHGQ